MFIPIICVARKNIGVCVYQKVFGNLQLEPDSSVNRHNNFQSFIGGLLLLFR